MTAGGEAKACGSREEVVEARMNGRDIGSKAKLRKKSRFVLSLCVVGS
jgi:hypothetical protein